MSAARYRNFMKLCEAWPVDPTKQGRDLAVLVRQRVADAFKRGENSQIADPAKCDRDYESLHKLSTDVHR
jgi:nucleoid factor 1